MWLGCWPASVSSIRCESICTEYRIQNQRAPFWSLSVKCLHEQNCGGPWWRGTCIALADRHWPARPADHLEALSARHVAHFLRTAPCSLEHESTAARQDLLLLGALFLCPGPPSPSTGFPLDLLPGLRPHLQQLLALATTTVATARIPSLSTDSSLQHLSPTATACCALLLRRTLLPTAFATNARIPGPVANRTRTRIRERAHIIQPASQPAKPSRVIYRCRPALCDHTL